jgi:hypothetical protein
VLPFPTLPVHSKPLGFRLRDAREHAHLHDDFAWVSSSFRFHRTTQCQSAHPLNTNHHQDANNQPSNRKNLLPILLAKVPEHTIPTPRRLVVVELERPVSVFDLHFGGVQQHVGGDVAACDFAAVGARAEMTARFLEQVFGEDCDLDAAAETAAGHAIGELGWVVLFGVAGEGGHVGWD